MSVNGQMALFAFGAAVFCGAVGVWYQLTGSPILSGVNYACALYDIKAALDTMGKMEKV